ncbi:MAG TPA: DUF1349 domain-containing protein, partial [Gaiellaceae bacterium]|nr:DUF1349 domain-containing protein [Gaiellaceae bacterium]
MPRTGLRGLGLAAIAAVVVLMAAPAAAASLQSDEFNAPVLDPAVWTFVDPLGDSTLGATGSHAVISVPAGQAHDMWASLDTAPRLLQATPNEDFEVEVKFDSAVTAGYQQQGIVVQGTGGALLRLELHSDGGGTKLFAAAIEPGSASVKHYAAVVGGAPAYLNVVRAGDAWTFRYSRDGATWLETATFAHALNVTAVGAFAGN